MIGGKKVTVGSRRDGEDTGRVLGEEEEEEDGRAH